MLNVGGLVEYPRGARRDRAGQPAVQGHRGSARQRRQETQRAGVDPAEPGRAVRRRQDGDRRRTADYAPIDISKHANQYRTERGWFGDARFTLKDLPVGEQKLAGVSYDIYDFPTSPVPTCIMLGGTERARTAARGSQRHRREPQGRRIVLPAHRPHRSAPQRAGKEQGQQHEIVRYVIHYADGQEAVLPISPRWTLTTTGSSSRSPCPAQLAWTRPYEGTEYHAAVYAKQWDNPRPNVEIRSLDVLQGANPAALPRCWP